VPATCPLGGTARLGRALQPGGEVPVTVVRGVLVAHRCVGGGVPGSTHHFSKRRA